MEMKYLLILSYTLGVFSLIEIIGQTFLHKSFFQFGIPIKNETFNLIIDQNNELNKVIIKDEGKYKFTSKSEIIFTSRWHLFSFFRFNSIIPIKNICNISYNKCEIISKLPIGTSLISIALIILPIFSNYIFKSPKDIIFYSDFKYIAPIFFSIMMAINLLVELNRYKKRKSELFELLNISHEK